MSWGFLVLVSLCALQRVSANSDHKNIIVMYTSFLPSSERSDLLFHLLGSRFKEFWKLSPRENMASQLPSDFDVITVEKFAEPFIRAVLLSAPQVKKVFDDRAYTRSTKAFHQRTATPTCSPRPTTRWSWENESTYEDFGQGRTRRHLLRSLPLESVTDSLQAEEVWKLGFTGQGVRVGIFDTGLRAGHPHFRNVQSRTDWTGEGSADDGVGHGTFVAGIIASSSQCLGLAPDSELHIFRVFTNKQVSYTSWFLDALNYAIYTEIDVINLSIGGPDFLDAPFVDKVNELIASNVVFVSAIGNDGPLFGTLNNPADMNNVIGVGGLAPDDEIAAFSSRGMTLWELPAGMGRIKPDIVAHSTNVRGSHFHHGCRALSGTSVASPVVAGAVALLASVVARDDPARATPASIKQALLETAVRLPTAGIFEQGHGRMDLPAAAALLAQYKPRASVVPAVFDATDCPYMWPYCAQPLFHGSAPLVANLTILNGMGALGWVGPPVWYAVSANGDALLDAAFEYGDVVWPWSGYFVLRLSARAAAASHRGVVKGIVVFNVTSPPAPGSTAAQVSTVTLPFAVAIAPTPPRKYRLLWDQFHSLNYPSGFFPRDSLHDTADPLDWHGDHPYTNFRGMYQFLRSLGYYIDILSTPFVCFDARDYAALLIVDPEDEFFDAEIVKLRRDVEQHGLHVVVFADWYSPAQMQRLKFFDDNTHNWWLPETGGSNVPALNRLLGAWGWRLAHGANSGDFSLGAHAASFVSGVVLEATPSEAVVVSALLTPDHDEAGTAGLSAGRSGTSWLGAVAGQALHGLGRVAVFGDSSCLDDAAHVAASRRCDWFLQLLLQDGLPTLERSSPRSAGTHALREPEDFPSSLFAYSRVLVNATQQRTIPACGHVSWSRPRASEEAPIAWPSTRLTTTGVARHTSSLQTEGPNWLLFVFVALICVLLVFGIKRRNDR